MLSEEQKEKTKKWIEANKSKFPKTLDGEIFYYPDVTFTAEIWITQLDANDNSTQKVAYSKLKQLFRDLKVKENWNKPFAIEKEPGEEINN